MSERAQEKLLLDLALRHAERDADFAAALAAGQVSAGIMQPLPLPPRRPIEISPDQAAQDKRAFARVMGQKESPTSALAKSLGTGRPVANLKRIKRGQ